MKITELEKKDEIVDEFLTKLVGEFQKYSLKHINNIKKEINIYDLPFIGREKQMQTLLVPSFNDLCSAVMAEVPIKNAGKQRWIDYWCKYKNSENKIGDFYIEIKHEYINVKGFLGNKKLLREQTLNSWLEGQKQLDNLKAGANKFWLNNNKAKKYRILLIILPIFEGSKENPPKFSENIVLDESHLESIYNEFNSKDLKKMNWAYLIPLNSTIFNDYMEFKHGFEKYYGVFFGATVVENN